MTRWWFAALLTLSCAAVSHAQISGPEGQERERLARIVFEKMRLSATMDVMLQQMSIAMRPMVAENISRSGVPAQHRERAVEMFMGKFAEEFNGPRFRQPYIAAAVQAYASEFERQDLEALIQFFDSPAGRKMLDKQAPMIQHLSQLGRQLGEEAGRRAGEATFQEMQRLGMLAGKEKP